MAVAREQNVTRAAARLHVSQPPLSRQIKDLEDELGVALFERGPQSVRLTSAGKVFLTEAQAVLRRAEEAVQAARVAGGTERGELDVAFAPSLTVQILPETLRLFQKSAPRVRVHLHDLSTEAMVAGLRERALDVALMIHPGRKQLRGIVFERTISLSASGGGASGSSAGAVAASARAGLAEGAAHRLFAGRLP